MDRGPLLRLALPLVALVALAGLAAPATLAAAAHAATGFVLDRAGGAVLAMATGCLVLALLLGLSPAGRERLGAADTPPAFSTPSWIAMLFAAGMGTGLVVWGAAEPLTHALSPPMGDPMTAAAIRQAMVITFLHWGLHAWAIYAIAALVIAWFAFREGRATTVSAPLAAILPRRLGAPVALAADLLGILAVVFGIAGTLAMGMLAIRSGLATLGLPLADGRALVWPLMGVGTVALVSAATPIGAGIRRLSDANILLALAMMALVFLVGPTADILALLARAVPDWLAALPRLSVSVAPFGPGSEGWSRDWTLTYFLWWLAWGPFVGIFIARISRGRSIRAFLAGVILVPTAGSMLWFSVMGGAALGAVGGDPAGPLAAAALDDPAGSLMRLLGGLPGAAWLAPAALLLLVIFLVTSIDSAAWVLAMMGRGGDPDPPVGARLGWGTALIALAAATLSVASVESARALAILGALPYPLILAAQAAALVVALGSAHRQRKAGRLVHPQPDRRKA